jgi:CRP/FNR family transcriptional regulator
MLKEDAHTGTGAKVMLTLKSGPCSQHNFGQQARRIEQISACPPAELILLRGHSFAEEGTTAHYTYLIRSGALLLSRLTCDGQRHVLGILGPGDVIGRALSPVYDCTIEPLTRTELQRLDGSLNRDREATMRFITQHMQRQLMACREHAVRLQSRSAEVKLASLLLSLPVERSERLSGSHNANSATCVCLRLADISDCLSLRLETISRIFSRFRRSGLISKPARGVVQILDLERLSRIAHPID